jgi:hypothetical protein
MMQLNEMINVIEELQEKLGIEREVCIHTDYNTIQHIEDFKNSITWIEEETKKDQIMAKFDELMKMIKDL